MFKSKFKNLIETEKSNISNFEILSEHQTIDVKGGCGALHSCNVFNGTCPNLVTCVRFTEPIGGNG